MFFLAINFSVEVFLLLPYIGHQPVAGRQRGAPHAGGCQCGGGPALCGDQDGAPGGPLAPGQALPSGWEEPERVVGWNISYK